MTDKVLHPYTGTVVFTINFVFQIRNGQVEVLTPESQVDRVPKEATCIQWKVVWEGIEPEDPDYVRITGIHFYEDCDRQVVRFPECFHMVNGEYGTQQGTRDWRVDFTNATVNPPGDEMVYQVTYATPTGSGSIDPTIKIDPRGGGGGEG